MTNRDTFDLFTPPDRGRFGENECGNDSLRSNADARSDLIEISMTLHIDKDRPLAVLCSKDGDRTKAFWLPRSKVDILEIGEPERKLRGMINQFVKVTMPQWLAKQKGLV